MMGGWGNHGYGMWGAGGMIMMIFFWAVIIVGAVLIFRYFTAGRGGIAAGQGGGSMARDRNPMEILRERYAKGEIDTEEFEQRKRTLEGEG
ncbi:MAG: SHOCT domain-containing protein [Deltaproteobacteria bacterium]|nr:SHOCT domain-containing protein [Deltaproteobacteria bacterium]